MTLPKIIIITGPTASGKSALAVDIAGRVGGRIVSADSAAVYRYLDIGTAKPPADVRAQIPHDLIDVIDPDRQYNAMAYARAADEAIGKIVAGGAVPIIAGGTGLYLKALVFGIFELPGSPGGGTVRSGSSARWRSTGWRGCQRARWKHVTGFRHRVMTGSRFVSRRKRTFWTSELTVGWTK
jgi:tRNA dimethylallyltransferase